MTTTLLESRLRARGFDNDSARAIASRCGGAATAQHAATAQPGPLSVSLLLHSLNSDDADVRGAATALLRPETAEAVAAMLFATDPAAQRFASAAELGAFLRGRAGLLRR